MTMLYDLRHPGYTISLQADAGWMGEAGPGPSYADKCSGELSHDFNQPNTTFMTWNFMPMARLLREAGGIRAHGNQRNNWNAGDRFVIGR